MYWKIDECSLYFDRLKISGWAYHPSLTIIGMDVLYEQTGDLIPLTSYGLSSPDLVPHFGARAASNRFNEWISGSSSLGLPFSVRFRFSDGSEEIGRDGLTNAAWGDAYYQSWENFISALDQFESGMVLEIGSRARSAISRRHRIPARLGYVGLDVLAGPNVDVIGDAHELAPVFPAQKFKAAFSASVFEHLMMPWKVVLELNAVLESGGIVYTSTHQTWPMHEEPWDFWRFSKHSWRALFNRATGFEIVEAVVGEPARVHACRTSEVTRDMPSSPAYLGSACLARKIGPVLASWPTPDEIGISDMYPAGELSRPPSNDPV